MRQILIAVAGLALALTVFTTSQPDSTERLAHSPSQTDAAGTKTAAEEDRPNIVVIMTDDMREDDLRWAPSIRKLAREEGVHFRNSFAPFPLCCPNRASFVSGQYAHNHGVLFHLDPWGFGSFDDSTSMATSLSTKGYHTGFVGKYLNGYGVQDSKVTGGPSYEYVPAGWDEWHALVTNPGDAPFKGGTYRYFRPAFNENGHVRSYRKYTTTVTANKTNRLISTFADDDEPFFIYANYIAPHFGGPRESDDLPRKINSRNGYSWIGATPARPQWVKGRFDDVIQRPNGIAKGKRIGEADMSGKPTPLRNRPDITPREYDALVTITRQRAESIYVVDRAVKTTVRRLKRAGEWANTVLVFTSDNGYLLGEHRLRQAKIRQYEPSARVPLLMMGPGIAEGKTIDSPATTLDLTATILDFAGAEADQLQDGQSLAGELRNPHQWDEPVLLEYMLPSNQFEETARTTDLQRRVFEETGDERTGVGVRTPRYSYMLLADDGPELYDMARDPYQLNNVAGRDKYDLVERQLARLTEKLAHCKGEDCSVALPPNLQAGGDRLRTMTDHYFTDFDKAYGYRAR